MERNVSLEGALEDSVVFHYGETKNAGMQQLGDMRTFQKMFF